MVTYNYGSTSSMRNYLKGRHKKTYSEVDGDQSSYRQTTLHSYNQRKGVLGDAKQQKFNRDVALACALDLHPISIAMG